MKSPFAGEVVARNDAAEADATILNKSPYKGLDRADEARRWERTALAGLVAGAVEGTGRGAEGFGDSLRVFTQCAFMAENESSPNAIHCEGFEA